MQLYKTVLCGMKLDTPVLFFRRHSHQPAKADANLTHFTHDAQYNMQVGVLRVNQLQSVQTFLQRYVSVPKVSLTLCKWY